MEMKPCRTADSLSLSRLCKVVILVCVVVEELLTMAHLQLTIFSSIHLVSHWYAICSDATSGRQKKR